MVPEPDAPRDLYPRDLSARDLSALALVVLALVALGTFWPTLAWLARSWKAHPYYSHGPVLVLVAAWLVWQRRARFQASAPAWSGLALVAGGACLAAAAAPRQAHAWEAVGLLAVLAGAAGLWGGRPALQAALYPLGLLALAVPLPFAERAAPLLSAHVARLAAGAAGALGTPVLRAGVELTVADGSYSVGGPCSGLRSILALVALAYVAVGFVDGSLPRRGAIVLAAVPVALAANWVRLTGLLVVTDHLGASAGLRVFEGPASPVLLLAGAGLLLAWGQRWSGPQ